MGIQDFGFQTYEGKRVSTMSRATAIAWSTIRNTFKGKKFIFFYLMCISPALLAFAIVYLRYIFMERVGGNWRLPFEDPDEVAFYFDPGRGMTPMTVLLFSAVAGAAVIAKDRAAGALELYFTRGIRPLHYFFGKWLAVFAMMMSQVLLPYLVVWIFGCLVAPAEIEFFSTTITFIPRLILAQAFVCASLSLFLTSLSSSTDSERFALLRWAGVLFLLMVVSGMMRGFFQDANWFAISPWNSVKRVAQWIVGIEPWNEFALMPALVSWGILTLLAILWTRRHLRPVEVVG